MNFSTIICIHFAPKDAWVESNVSLQGFVVVRIRTARVSSRRWRPPLVVQRSFSIYQGLTATKTLDMASDSKEVRFLNYGSFGVFGDEVVTKHWGKVTCVSTAILEGRNNDSTLLLLRLECGCFLWCSSTFGVLAWTEKPSNLQNRATSESLQAVFDLKILQPETRTESNANNSLAEN